MTDELKSQTITDELSTGDGCIKVTTFSAEKSHKSALLAKDENDNSAGLAFPALQFFHWGRIASQYYNPFLMKESVLLSITVFPGIGDLYTSLTGSLHLN